jgi:hypothetical protein
MKTYTEPALVAYGTLTELVLSQAGQQYAERQSPTGGDCLNLTSDNTDSVRCTDIDGNPVDSSMGAIL